MQSNQAASYYNDGLKRLPDCATSYEPVDLTTEDYVPNDPFRAIYVGGEGDIVVADIRTGKTCTFTGVQPGILPVAGRKIVKEGTTATDLVALF